MPQTVTVATDLASSLAAMRFLRLSNRSRMNAGKDKGVAGLLRESSSRTATVAHFIATRVTIAVVALSTNSAL